MITTSKITLSGMLLRMSGELRNAKSDGHLDDFEADLADEIAEDLEAQAKVAAQVARNRSTRASCRRVKS